MVLTSKCTITRSYRPSNWIWGGRKSKERRTRKWERNGRDKENKGRKGIEKNEGGWKIGDGRREEERKERKEGEGRKKVEGRSTTS